jgi:hypothetical protein
MEQVEAMQLQMGLLDFKLSITIGFVLDVIVLRSVVPLVFWRGLIIILRRMLRMY